MAASGSQRFCEGLIGFDFAMLFSGIADVREWYDDAEVQWRRVSVIPAHIVPTRQEQRE